MDNSSNHFIFDFTPFVPEKFSYRYSIPNEKVHRWDRECFSAPQNGASHQKRTSTRSVVNQEHEIPAPKPILRAR